ncbi:hypothetical protein PENTCL1PPCAC_17662, partial [Pristionchus entomophagus]
SVGRISERTREDRDPSTTSPSHSPSLDASPGALPSSSSSSIAYTQNETSYYHLLQLKQQRKRLFRRLK